MSGVFYVSSSRFVIDSGMLDVSGAETRLNDWVPIKINILIWRIRLENISTRERLSYRGLELHMIMCPVCHNVVETIYHLFVGCRELTN